MRNYGNDAFVTYLSMIILGECFDGPGGVGSDGIGLIFLY